MKEKTLREIISEYKYIDYKNVNLLKKFIDINGRILSAKKTEIPAKKMRKIKQAIKRARFMGLLPFIANK